ncbi:hypothetical protein B9Z19DRAFT_1022673 [Tuber borchii]|uniref:VWFA domain-containing protein n=1 Tax=Tuber borchii TaxID=42251 RepID=A0A2T6ZWJ3_TUBBO|nr:hypothetical protein B9Z19DRAFT_1022673 [Tuber borchii]
MSTTPPVTRQQAKELGVEPKQKVDSGDQSSTDSDYSKHGENTDDRESQEEQQATAEPKEKAVPSSEMISQGLKDLVREHRKGLENMYGTTEEELNKSLEEPIKRGEEMVRRLISDMECTFEVAKDLTALTLYDLAILIDDSDSMISEEEGQRKKTLIQLIDHITDIYSLANESGVFAMRFMNRSGGKKNWKEKSEKYLSEHKYGGVTRIGTELKKKILDKFAIGNSNQRKPLLVLIITDGAVEGEKKGHLKNVIRDCVNERKGAGKGFEAVTFQFSRIGDDPGAAQLLIDLDQDPDLGDYIDVLPVEFDLKHQLEEDKWFVLPKILLGAILPKWDEQDYYNYIRGEDHLAKKKKAAEDADSGSDWEDK